MIPFLYDILMNDNLDQHILCRSQTDFLNFVPNLENAFSGFATSWLASKLSCNALFWQHRTHLMTGFQNYEIRKAFHIRLAPFLVCRPWKYSKMPNFYDCRIFQAYKATWQVDYCESVNPIFELKIKRCV